jgi:hypothetical protein
MHAAPQPGDVTYIYPRHLRYPTVTQDSYIDYCNNELSEGDEAGGESLVRRRQVDAPGECGPSEFRLSEIGAEADRAVFGIARPPWHGIPLR